jgi:hypothetical protein
MHDLEQAPFVRLPAGGDVRGEEGIAGSTHEIIVSM